MTHAHTKNNRTGNRYCSLDLLHLGKETHYLRMRLLVLRGCATRCLLPLLVLLYGGVVDASADDNDRHYTIVGVSGGLQDGFPDRINMDYHSGQEDESKALFLGRGLVRGYKAYLDVMQEEWRQYIPEPGQPLINCNVFASGCYEHANQYWIYILDSRQVMSVLQHEPRFLSITPDTGQIELDAAETDPAVKAFLLNEIKKQRKSDVEHVALPLVTAVWFHESHVPSPPIRVHADGTEVSNFPESLSLWANVNPEDRFAKKCDDEEQICKGDDAQQNFWDGIRARIRTAEKNRPTLEESNEFGPPFKCKNKVRFGASQETARVNYSFSTSEIKEKLEAIGMDVDFGQGEMTMK